MDKLIYIAEYISWDNGQKILDSRIEAELKKIAGENFVIAHYENKKGFKENISLESLDNANNVMLFSHFNTFRLASKIKKSRKVFLHHDLPYYAYLNEGGAANIAKAVYFWLYIHYHTRYANFNFFISKREMRLSKINTAKCDHIYIGIKETGNNTRRFDNISGDVLFTGNYKWSLKKRSLNKAFATGYNGNLSLVAINTDETFKTVATENTIPVVYNNDYSSNNAVGIGIITDSFLSGFKLKALEMIRMGCCIASFCDLSEEFNEMPFYELFVKRIYKLNDIDDYYKELKSQENVTEKFRQFYNAVTEKFSWKRSAEKLYSKFQSV